VYPAPAGQPYPAPAGQPYPAPAGQPYPAPAGEPHPAPGEQTYPATGGQTAAGGLTYAAPGGPAFPAAGRPVYQAVGRPTYAAAEGATERLAVTHEPAQPTDPAPDETLDPDEIQADRSWVPTLAMTIAVIALAVAGGATVTAWQAFDTAGQAAAMKHMPVAAPVVLPSVAPPSEAPATPVPAGYLMKYAQEPLQIKTDCGTSALVDLDVPRTGGPAQQGDLRYDNICSADGPLLGLGAGARAGAVVADADTDAPGCADAVRTGPLEEGDNVPVQKGTALCVLTGTAGTPSVLVLVEVTGLDAKGRVSMRATAWSGAARPTASDAARPTAAGPTPPADDTKPGATEEQTPGATGGDNEGGAVPSDEATPGE
jgi:hypothetical protein